MPILRLEQFLWLLSCLMVNVGVAVYNRTETKPGCQSKCGSLDIPYPFGIGENCSFSFYTRVNCNTSFNPPKPYIGRSRAEIVHLSPTEIRVKLGVATNCFNESGFETWSSSRFNMSQTPYTFSSTKNKLFTIGCDTYVSATVYDDHAGSGLSCSTICDKREMVADGSCSGIGCCQIPIPRGLKVYNFFVSSYDHYSKVRSFDTCGFAFIAEEDRYTFKVSDFKNITSLLDNHIVINFALENKTCQQAKQNATSFACKDNSYCYDFFDGPGYLCSCNKGYQGNPYLKHSCQDVNECEDPSKNPCKGICTNTEGSYQCSCPADSHGDGTKDGTGCTKRHKRFPVLQLTLGLGLGFLFMFICCFGLKISLKKRRLYKQKEKFFQRNGGLLLKQQISSHETGVEQPKIFTLEELKLATNNYDQDRILGKGGSGTVYKGILPDLRNVAVKKARMVNESQLAEFINEVVILIQINHRNVVKLLGCCLEAEVPVLVYEYVSNGTLFHHLHGKGELTFLSWQDRLRIAAETASALAYLHSAVSIPIFHRDVKSTNILLDDNYTAKVADFGASRLNPLDETQISTLIQGTMGYLDPSYFHTGQLTDKSDVYSFGVILAELLTGEKPLCFERSQEQRHLATYFTLSVNENHWSQILDARIMKGGKEQVHAVMQLAYKCLYVNGDKRPSMKEVAMELEGLRSFYKDHPVTKDNEGPTSFAYEHVDLYAIPSSSFYSGDGTLCNYSSDTERMQPMNVPR